MRLCKALHGAGKEEMCIGACNKGLAMHPGDAHICAMLDIYRCRPVIPAVDDSVAALLESFREHGGGPAGAGISKCGSR